MSARSLLIALFCFSIVAAYGPVFVLDKVEGESEIYINDKIDYSDLEGYILPREDDTLFIVANASNIESVMELLPFTKQFSRRVVVPHFVGSLNVTDYKVVQTVEELSQIEVGNWTIVLHFDADAPEEPVKYPTISKGISMTPAVLFALLTIFTLGYGLYSAIICIDQIQTPTAYTDKVLAVGKEF